MTIPVSVAMGSAMVMSRLTRESELTVMRASGVPILRTIVPFTVIGIVAGVLSYFNSDFLMPPALRDFATNAGKTAMLNVIPNFASNSMFRLQEWDVSVGAVQRTGITTATFNQVLLIEHPRAGQYMIIEADIGTYDRGVFRCPNAYAFVLRGDNLISAKPKSLTINEPVNLDNIINPPDKSQQTAATLWKSIQEAKQENLPSKELEVEFYSRYSVPLACVILGIVSPILSVHFGRTGTVAGVLLSILLLFLYYNAHIVATDVLGKLGWVHPALAAWLTNILFVCLGLFGLRRLE
jgi:lipopolysaccharide export LptBFGC system permease protein LptF